MKKPQDAYGRMLLDALEGEDVAEIVERDDGFVMASRFGPEVYLAPYRRWPSRQRRAMRLVRGRVLDVGCGAGRVGLHLQSRGHEVVGIDVSPLAVQVARQRGLDDARVGTLDSAVGLDERFDTILLLGNNLGLLAGERQGRRLLRRLVRVAVDKGRILAGSWDPYDGASELSRRYHARNRDVLFASREEVASLVQGTGWAASRFLGDGAGYVAVLELE